MPTARGKKKTPKKAPPVVTAKDSREELFAAEFAAFPNGRRAAVKAGYAQKGAHVAASRLLSNPKVRAEITRIRRKALDKLGITVERTLMEIARVAYADATDAITVEDGAVIVADLRELPSDLRAAVASVAETKEGLRVRFHGKSEALRLLADVQGMFKVAHAGGPLPPVVLNGVQLDEESGDE